MFKILFISVGVHDVLGVFMPQCKCLGQRTTLCNMFLPAFYLYTGFSDPIQVKKACMARTFTP